MDDDINVRKLLECIFIKQDTNNEEITAYWLTQEFLQSLYSILTSKQVIAICRWKIFFDTCCYNMFTSHELYLKYMMFICRSEHGHHKNIFESFISVCAVLLNLTSETLKKTNMNLFNLNPDIIMVFYKSIMKKNFLKCGGFRKLVEYILGHRYLAWNIPGASVTSMNNYKAGKLAEEMLKEKVCALVVRVDDIDKDYSSGVLGNKCLGSTSIALPTLLSKPELIQKLVEYRRSEITKTCEKNLKTEVIQKSEHLEETSLPNSDSTPISATKKENFTRGYDEIIQAVMKHNHSKNTTLKNLNNSTLDEADEILEHLKGGIQSIIKVLDEYDKE